MSQSLSFSARPNRLAAALLLGLGVLPQSWAAPGNDVVDALDATLARLARQQSLPVDEDARSIERPARTHYELGAVVDSRPLDGGLPMLMALTPGGAAERIGLRVGDRLKSMNVHALDAQSGGEGFREALQAAAGHADIEVLRDNQVVHLAGELDAVQLPGYRLSIDAPPLPGAALLAGAGVASDDTCGRISVFDNAPRSKQLYPAVLIAIDGNIAGPGAATGAYSYRLEPGLHTLTVAEEIDAKRSVLAENRQIDGLRNGRHKLLQVEVKPGITYRLAAQFHLDRRNEIRTGAYWDPVIWKESPERCR